MYSHVKKKQQQKHTHTQRRTFYSQHHGDEEAAHPQQVIHRHKPGVCNMKKGVDWTHSDGWMDRRMETHTRSAAAELCVPLRALMPSAVMRGSLCAPFPPAHNPQEEPSAPSPAPAAPSRCIQSGPVIRELRPPPLHTLSPASLSFSLAHFTDTQPPSRGASPGLLPSGRAEDGDRRSEALSV